MAKKKKQSGKKRLSGYWLSVIIIATVTVFLNVLAIVCTPFADWHWKYIYPLFLNSVGRFTNLFPFSIGEWLAFIVINALLILVFWWIPAVILKIRKKGVRFRRFTCSLYRFALLAGCCILLFMTLTEFILDHTTPLDPNLGREKREYTVEELITVYNYVSDKINLYSCLQTRDEDGWIIADKKETMENAAEALRGISKRYPQLAGWYPQVKPLFFSGIVTRMGFAGYFYPYSMEADYNALMYEGNYDTFVHELAHSHGFMREDEANFLAYAACTECGDLFLAYCGYMSVISYMDRDLHQSLAQLSQDEINGLPEILGPYSIYFDQDWCFLKPEQQEQLDESDEFLTDIVSPETIDHVASEVADITIKMSGQSGMAAYGEVVGLLLQYYDGVLY
ncbi:MAG: DUF3810 domain-containing protein [Lachnospiraceae bacterium]|nr:DUF3810 domain-containing protein [Lachnospiraceae bacterium]